MSDHGGKRDPQAPTNTLYWIVGTVLALMGLALFLFAIANTPAIELLGTMPKSVGTIFNKLGVEGLSFPWTGGCAHWPWLSKDEATAYCQGKKGFVIPFGDDEGAIGPIGSASAQISLDTALRQYNLGAWDGANGACEMANTAYAQAVSEQNAAVQSQAEILVRECNTALSALQGLNTCNPLSDPVTCITHADQVLTRHAANRQAADIRAVAYRSQEWETLRQSAAQFRYDDESDDWSQQWPPTRRQQLLDLLWKRRFSIIDGIDRGIVRSPADNIRVALIDVPTYTPTGASEPVSSAPIEFTLPLGVIGELMGQDPESMDPGVYQGWDRQHQLGTIPGGYSQPPDPQPIPPPPTSAPLDLNPQPKPVATTAAPAQEVPVAPASPSCVANTAVPADWPVFLFDATSGLPTEVTGQYQAAGAVLTGEFVGEGTQVLCKTGMQIADGRFIHVWPGPLFGWTR